MPNSDQPRVRLVLYCCESQPAMVQAEIHSLTNSQPGYHLNVFFLILSFNGHFPGEPGLASVY